ncbi:MAG: acyl carrier protein [Clostridia bacterium]|nr:acyl carrier protein [Clostridia bacterium]MBO7406059.1 acyl carrier protein [Clostridia bacterium]MBP5780741.1 acyl carrier protein [Clostridia bacterium]
MFDRTVAILADHIDGNAEDITRESALVDDLGLSSLEVITIVSEFESEFDIEVPDRVIPTLRTVGDIVDYLEKNAE